jgi:poly(beta-D-mannuronate) lyase
MKIFCGALLIIFTGALSEVAARMYPITSARELRELALKPGDTVVLKAGTWDDAQLLFTGAGTKQRPIVLMAFDPGKIVLKGNASLEIDGTWLVVSGLSFAAGNIKKEDAVLFSDSSSWCRLTNSSIVDYNPPDKKIDSRYVSLKGHHNRVDHCYFKGKTNHGPTLVVWLSAKPNYHQIDHNHFGQRPPLGENGGESIRIGTSTWSMYNSYTTVEYNLFDHCDGELEIISNKSCHNTLRYNTFFESQGTLTLRHGNDAVVYGNYFIGNGLPKTGGIRIIGENHVVFGNYFRDLSGTGVSAAVCLVDGLPNSPLTGYFQVKNAQVIDNTIVHCEEAFAVGTGKSKDRNLLPLNCTIASNNILPGTTLLKWEDTPEDIRVENNKVYKKSDASLPPGFNVISPRVFQDPLKNFNKDLKTKPPLLHADVGPSWREKI